LSLEHLGRHYGNGMLKIEPSALKAALVYAPSRKASPSDEFDKVSSLLTKGKKAEASEVASKVLKKHAEVHAGTCKMVRAALHAIRLRRF